MSGAKGKYTQELVDRICKMVETDEFTVSEICKAVKISTETYFVWLREKPEFSDAIKKAQDKRFKDFALEAKKSLLKKIKGYEVKEKKVTTRKGVVTEEVEATKHFAPDTTALIFALKNLDSENFKDKQEVEHSGNVVQNVVLSLPPRKDKK